jgi:hypothetical protein
MSIVVVFLDGCDAHLAWRRCFGRMRMVCNAGAATQLEAPRGKGEKHKRGEHADARGHEGGTREVARRAGRGGVVGEDLRCRQGPDNGGQRAGGIHGALQLALAVVGHLPRQDAVDGGRREATDRADHDGQVEHVEIGGKAQGREGCHCRQQAHHGHGGLANATRQWAGNHRLADGKAQAESPERAADGRGAEAEHFHGEIAEHGRQRLGGKLEEEQHGQQPQHRRIGPERHYRAQRVGATDVELAARRLGQAFGQDEQAEEEIGKGQAGRCIKWHARAEFAEFAAHNRSDDESEAEGGADEAEAVRALVGWRDVGHVGRCGGKGRAGNTGNDTADEEVPNYRRDRHHQIVERQPEQGGQQHRAAAETVGQIPQDRGKDELHEGIGEDQVATDDGRIGDAAAGKVFEQFGQHGHNDADADHVQQDRHQNAGEGQA